MSFAVVKGSATSGQLHLDSVLDALVAESGREEDRYCIGKLLFKCLKDRPDSINTIEGSSGKQLLNRELLALSIRTGNALRQAGVEKEDVILINGSSHLHLSVPYYASLFLGALPIHIDINATTNELTKYINLTKPKFIFTDAQKILTLEEALAESCVKAPIVTFGAETTAGHENLHEFSIKFSGDIESFRLEDVDRKSPALLACTSGSTGSPKAAVLANYGLVSKIMDFSSSSEVLELTEPGSKFLLTSSSQWVSYIMFMNSCLFADRIKLQTTQPATVQHILELCSKYKPSHTMFGPTFASALLESGEYSPGDLRCFKQVLLGGAHVGAELQSAVKRAIHPESSVMVAYGLTELAGCVIMQDSECDLGSIGREVNSSDHKIVNEDGKIAAVGEPGELWLKPKETVFIEYFKDEATTAEILTSDGWLKTGDIVYKDAKGQYFFVDRIKLLIKVSSYHVYPKELEEVIQSVPGVKQAGVCGLERGLTAVVVPRPGYQLTAQQIHDKVNSELSYYKQLAGGVYFTEALPMTISGKLDRKAMSALLT